MTHTLETKPFDEKTYIMWMHLSQLAGFVGIPMFVVPLIMWLTKKDYSQKVDAEGKEILNFQISLMIAIGIAFVLIFLFIGFLILPVLMIIATVLPIVAAIKINKGESYRYPFTYRFIK